MKDILKIILFVIILAIISAGILMGTQALTSEKIAVNEGIKVKSSVLSAFGIKFESDTADSIFASKIREIDLNDNGAMAYKTDNDDIAFIFEGAGLWGNITGIIALDKNLETIVGIKILSQVETPGLGGRISEREYLDQFIGKKIIPELLIVKNKSVLAENEVDGISGATLTSEKLQDIINDNVTIYRNYKDLLVD